MRAPRFQVAVDVHGRDAGGLEPGAVLTIDLSAVSNGAFLPGDRDEIAQDIWMIRIAATKDCYIHFSAAAEAATSSDLLFQAGTESMKLPYGKGYVSAITFNPADTGKLQICLLR